MKTRYQLASAGFAVLCATAVMAQAASATPRLGSAAFQSVRLCGGLPDDVNCAGPANPDFLRKETYTPGGERVDVNSVIVPRPENGGGRIVSRVRSTGALDLPEIKSGVWAGDNNRLSSGIAVYGGFTHTGPSPLPFALDVDIDWTGTGAPLAYAELEAGVPGQLGEYGGEARGRAGLILMDAAFVPIFASGFDIAIFAPGQSCGSPGVLALNGLSLIAPAAGPADAGFTLEAGCDGLPIMLAPGASYVLFTEMQTIANRFGVFDATNTIRVTLSEALPEEVRTQLVEQVVTDRSVVPQPASWAMVIAAWGVLASRGRQRRATRDDAVSARHRF